MVYSAVELFLIFISYSFLGWCLEVVVSLIETKKLVNRGFLIGPICPIYGFAVTSIILANTYIVKDVISLFVFSVIVTSIFELVTGYILESAFDKKWWDYTNYPLNIGGYVCLFVSIFWGFTSVFAVYVVQPIIMNLIHSQSLSVGTIICYFISIFLIADIALTAYSLVVVKKRMEVLGDVRKRINALSASIGSSDIMNKIGDINIQNELENLKARYQNILSKYAFGNDRIAKAFPHLNLVKIKRIKRRKNK